MPCAALHHQYGHHSQTISGHHNQPISLDYPSRRLIGLSLQCSLLLRKGDYFWTAIIPSDGYDTTIYADQGRGSRLAVLEELQRLARESSSWQEQNRYVASPDSPIYDTYLINWHLLALGRAITSDGHPAALSLGAAAATRRALGTTPEGQAARWVDRGWLRGSALGEQHSTELLPAPALLHVFGGCHFSPPVVETVRLAADASCDTCAALRYTEVGGLTAATLLLAVLVAAVLRCLCRRFAQTGHERTGRMASMRSGNSAGARSTGQPDESERATIAAALRAPLLQ